MRALVPPLMVRSAHHLSGTWPENGHLEQQTPGHCRCQCEGKESPAPLICSPLWSTGKRTQEQASNAHTAATMPSLQPQCPRCSHNLLPAWPTPSRRHTVPSPGRMSPSLGMGHEVPRSSRCSSETSCLEDKATCELPAQ